MTVEPVREILKDGSKDNLSAIVGSGIFFDEISRCRDVNSLQSELAVLLEKYRKPDTAVAFGRKPFGTSKPYFIGPNTDIKKMINKIISNSSDHEIKGIMHDDTVVIKDMYKGLMRGDATSQKYAIQLKETAKEINSELPKESTLKTLLSYAISHMT